MDALPLRAEDAEEFHGAFVGVAEPVGEMGVEFGDFAVGEDDVLAAEDDAERAEVLAPLGLAPSPHPSGLGAYIAADPTGLTPVPGVWVAGNLADPNANVLGSAASGSTAAGAINADLIAEDIRHAVQAHNDPFSPGSEARVCEKVMGDRRHGLDPIVGQSTG